MLARRTKVAASGIGILTSCAEVDGGWLLMVNRRTVAELSCAHSSTQGAGSLPMISSLFVEWMERSQGGMRRLSPAARAHQAKRGIIMYRRPVGLLLSCLAVPVLKGNRCTSIDLCVLRVSVITNPSIHTFTKAHMHAVP